MGTRQQAIDALNAKMPKGVRVAFEQYTADYKRFSRRPFKVYEGGKMIVHFGCMAAIEQRFCKGGK